jgi:hypothetical protein
VIRALVASTTVLLLAAAPAVGSATLSGGGIRLGTWTADLGSTASGARSKITMRLTLTGSGEHTAARLKLFRYTGTCTFLPDPAAPQNPVPPPITVTWTYDHPNSLGPIAFTRARQSGQAVDLDENQPGPMSLKIHFSSATKATGTVQANETPKGTGATCDTGKSALDSRVRFTAHWLRQ